VLCETHNVQKSGSERGLNDFPKPVLASSASSAGTRPVARRIRNEDSRGL